MIEQSDDLWSRVNTVAQQASRSYVQGILSVEELTEQILREWKTGCVEDDVPSHGVLTRIAQRICSRTLCIAWRSCELDVRNRAFDNLRRYLECSLRNSGYAQTLQQYEHALDDVLHQTIEELHLSLTRNPEAGPSDPAAFLKWVQTAVIRHAHVFVQKMKSSRHDSLEAQEETFAEQFIDQRNPDPQDYVLSQELQQALKNAILSLRNPHHRQVLLYTYLAEMDEHEVAALLHVEVQQVYLWRYRALRALRKNPELMRIWQTLRE